MFSEEEKRRLLSSVEKLLEDGEKFKEWQETQDDRLSAIERSINDTPENDQDGMRSKVNRTAKTVDDWQSQGKGILKVAGAITFLISSGILALVINAFAGSG